MLVQEGIHAVEGRTRGHRDSANGCLPEYQRHQAERGGLPGQEADLGNTTRSLGGCDGLVQALSARNVQQEVYALAVGEFQNFLFPAWEGSIVDAGNGPELLHRVQILVTAGGD